MNSNNPTPIDRPTSTNNFLVTAPPLADKGSQGDVDLGTQQESVLTDESIDTSVVTMDSVPELNAAYNKTFLQITPPSIPQKEILSQLEPFSKIVAAELNKNLTLSEYLNTEANVQTSTDILNIIEKAMEEGDTLKRLYGETGINAAVTNDTSPAGIQGVHMQDTLLHSLGAIVQISLGTPTHTAETITQKNTNSATQPAFSSDSEMQEKENSSVTMNTLNRIFGNNGASVTKNQSLGQHLFTNSLNESLSTLKELINNHSLANAIVA